MTYDIEFDFSAFTFFHSKKGCDFQGMIVFGWDDLAKQIKIFVLQIFCCARYIGAKYFFVSNIFCDPLPLPPFEREEQHINSRPVAGLSVKAKSGGRKQLVPNPTHLLSPKKGFSIKRCGWRCKFFEFVFSKIWSSSNRDIDIWFQIQLWFPLVKPDPILIVIPTRDQMILD